MMLSISQAATILGKSERQIRYMIKTGQVEFQKQGGRYFLDDAKLPISVAQRSAVAKNVVAAKAAVERALAPAQAIDASKQAAESRHYSVTELKSFQVGEGLFRELLQIVGGTDPAVSELRETLVLITRACHSFHPAHKVERLNQARDRLADALTSLLLAGDEPRRSLGLRIEQELFPRLSGMLASHERRFRRSRFERFDSSARSGGG